MDVLLGSLVNLSPLTVKARSPMPILVVIEVCLVFCFSVFVTDLLFLLRNEPVL